MATDFTMPSMFDTRYAMDRQMEIDAQTAGQSGLGGRYGMYYNSSLLGDRDNASLMNLAGMFGGGGDPRMQKQMAIDSIMQQYPNPETAEDFKAISGALRQSGLYEEADRAMSMANEIVANMPEANKKVDVTKSIQWLKDNNMTDLAAIVEANPSMVTDVMKAAMKDKGIGDTNLAVKTSAVFVDQETGQQYVVATDPNKPQGERVSRVDIKDAFAPTKEEELKLAAQQELIKTDKIKARQAAQEAFKQADGLRFQINDFNRALIASEEGAVSGVIGKYLPAFNQQTATLNSVANTLGISVINMATFGALSEREMAMAMRTNLDMNLPPEELKGMIIEQMNARTKLMNELYTAAQRLSSGEITYSEYITEVADNQLEASKYQYNKLTKEERSNITADKWLELNLQQRKQFVSLRN